MSVFSRLRRLFRSTGFPDEDFLTEIVFSFVERHPDRFIQWLRDARATDLPTTSSVSAATQYHSAESLEDNLPAKRPDILLWLRNGTEQHVLFIESKVESPLSGQDQLQQYARILSKLPTGATKTLLFVTKNYSPQDREQLFSGIPVLERPKFVQARWYEFSTFLMKQSDLSDDSLTAEILDYMKERQLDIPNKFTPLDITSLTGLGHALSVMRAVLEGELAKEFESAFGSVIDQYDRDSKVAKYGLYVHQPAPGKKGNTNVTLGFWFGDDQSDYPWIYADLVFDGKTQNKAQVIDALHKYAEQSNGRWQEENVVATSTSGRIHHDASIGQFLGSDDHVVAIRRYMSDLLKEIANFRRAHPELV